MSRKRLLLCAAVVFIVKAVAGAICFGLVLDDFYDSDSVVFRPEGQEHHGIGMVGELAWAIAFTYIYTRSSDGRGWTEGFRFGFLVWVFYFVPMTLGVFAYFAVDARWAIGALGVGIAESLLCGVSAALVHGERCAFAPLPV
jgi:hypothetical protein